MRERGRVGHFCTCGAAALVAMALFASSASAAGGSVSGTVTASGSGSPVFGAQVCALPKSHEFDPGQFCVFSGASGKYSLAQLPADEYVLEFHAGYLNYLPQYYPDKVKLSEAEKFQLAEGESLENRDAHLKVAAELTGTVTDAGTEEGVGGVEVCAYGQIGFTEECVITGPFGDYSMPGLPSDEYVVEFFPEASSGYLVQFYDHVGALSESSPVPVSVGEVRSGIDAALVPGSAVSGRVTLANGGTPLAGVLVCAERAASEELESCVKTTGDGSYSIDALASGSYVIAFSEELGPEFADEFDTQYFDRATSFAAAAPVTLAAPETRSGVDGHLLRHGESLSTPVITTPPPPVDQSTGGLPKPPLKCRKGFVKKKVHGTQRCVKKKHRHRRHRRRG